MACFESKKGGMREANNHDKTIEDVAGFSPVRTWVGWRTTIFKRPRTNKLILLEVNIMRVTGGWKLHRERRRVDQTKVDTLRGYFLPSFGALPRGGEKVRFCAFCAVT